MAPDSTFARLFPLLFVVLGVGFCWVGLYLVLSGRRLRKTGVRVPGVVVRLNWSATENGGNYHPVMRFRTADGQDLEVESVIGSNPAPAREGQQVTVIYDPAKPQRARLDSMLGRGAFVGWLFTVVGAVVAVVAAVIGLNNL